METFLLGNATIISADSPLPAETQTLSLQAGAVLLLSPWESITVGEKKGKPTVRAAASLE